MYHSSFHLPIFLPRRRFSFSFIDYGEASRCSSAKEMRQEMRWMLNFSDLRYNVLSACDKMPLYFSHKRLFFKNWMKTVHSTWVKDNNPISNARPQKDWRFMALTYLKTRLIVWMNMNENKGVELVKNLNLNWRVIATKIASTGAAIWLRGTEGEHY